ncbi:MAG: hypothetical protein IT423_11535 [Pirellulaceae bacterium]|nr:hypothetical protein [Pirellulaceae bacterium]
MDERRLLIGIGSHHGYDRLGWLVAEEIESRQCSGLDVRVASTPLKLLDWLDNYAEVHVCDASQGVAAHGADTVADQVAVHRWQWPSQEIDRRRWCGTHDMSLPAVLELAAQLGMFGCPVIVWGLELPGHLLSLGNASPPPELVRSIANQISLAIGQPSLG